MTEETSSACTPCCAITSSSAARYSGCATTVAGIDRENFHTRSGVSSAGPA
jgi:hypothetical protein